MAGVRRQYPPIIKLRFFLFQVVQLCGMTSAAGIGPRWDRWSRSRVPTSPCLVTSKVNELLAVLQCYYLAVSALLPLCGLWRLGVFLLWGHRGLLCRLLCVNLAAESAAPPTVYTTPPPPEPRLIQLAGLRKTKHACDLSCIIRKTDRRIQMQLRC